MFSGIQCVRSSLKSIILRKTQSKNKDSSILCTECQSHLFSHIIKTMNSTLYCFVLNKLLFLPQQQKKKQVLLLTYKLLHIHTHMQTEIKNYAQVTNCFSLLIWNLNSKIKLPFFCCCCFWLGFKNKPLLHYIIK